VGYALEYENILGYENSTLLQNHANTLGEILRIDLFGRLEKFASSQQAK